MDFIKLHLSLSINTKLDYPSLLSILNSQHCYQNYFLYLKLHLMVLNENFQNLEKEIQKKKLHTVSEFCIKSCL